MLSSRWRKVLRDLSHYRSRAALATAAIAVGVFALMTVLVAYSVLSRELARGYQGTRPATATLVFAQAIRPELLQAVRRAPGVLAAEPRRTLRARVRPDANSPENSPWTPMVLFVIDDFQALSVSTFKTQAGAWPPPPDALLLERSALPVLAAEIGQSLQLRLPGGAERKLSLSGTVHDPGQAPGWMDGVVTAYVAKQSLSQLGINGGLDELRVVLAESPNRAAAERAARGLAGWLSARGWPVVRIEVPPPGQHPHQTQMNALLAIIAVFGLFALLLAGSLTSATVSALLAQQLRQIGIMKALGARSAQVAGLYLVFVLILEIAAVLLAIPAGYLAGQAGADWASRTLNFELLNRAAPAWTFAAALALGLILPLLVALGPIRRGTRVTVREALTETGVVSGGPLARRLNRLRILPRPVVIGLANAFRQRGRLALTVVMLAASGAVFITALNVARSWETTLDHAFAGRRYDLDARLEHPTAPERLTRLAATLPTAQLSEAWPLADAARIHTGEADIVSTYPGAVHGGLSVLAPPLTSQLLTLPLLQGRRLNDAEPQAAVVNRKFLADEPDLGLGDSLSLRLAGRASDWRIVGIVDEPGAAPSVYITPEAFAAVTQHRQATSLRIRLSDRSPAAEAESAAALEQALEADGLSVASLQQTTTLRQSFDKHITILITALFAMAGLVALVGGLGLASTLGINVVERTREFGVMQAIGARPRDIFYVVESEGLAIGLLSWALSLILCIPLTHALAHIGGHVGLGRSLDIAIDPGGMLLWLGLVLVLTLLAALAPARSAASLTVKELLAYE